MVLLNKKLNREHHVLISNQSSSTWVPSHRLVHSSSKSSDRLLFHNTIFSSFWCSFKHVFKRSSSSSTISAKLFPHPRVGIFWCFINLFKWFTSSLFSPTFVSSKLRRKGNAESGSEIKCEKSPVNLLPHKLSVQSVSQSPMLPNNLLQDFGSILISGKWSERNVCSRTQSQGFNDFYHVYSAACPTLFPFRSKLVRCLHRGRLFRNSVPSSSAIEQLSRYKLSSGGSAPMFFIMSPR